MKKLTLLTTILAALAIPAFAAETKIEGEAVCAKCNLKTATECQAAITVTGADGKKETLSYDALGRVRGIEARKGRALAFDIEPSGKRRVLDAVP